MADNYSNHQSVYQTNDINITPISFLYQKLYSIYSIKFKNRHTYLCPKKILLKSKYL